MTLGRNPVTDRFRIKSMPELRSSIALRHSSSVRSGRWGRTKSRYRSFSAAAFLSFAGFSSSSAKRLSSPYQRSLSSGQRTTDSSMALPHISAGDDLVTLSESPRKYSLDS